MPDQKTKYSILKALEHVEAEDGLYFRNFYEHHEADEREQVEADQLKILDALQDLIDQGEVTIDDSGPEPIFFRKR